MPPESTNLATRSATKILADRPTMNLVAEAISTAKGLTYLDSLDAYQTRLEQLGPQASLGDVLGTDVGEVLPLVKLRQVHEGTERKLLDSELAKTTAGTAQVVGGRVIIPAGTDSAPWLADPVERERRLKRMQAARPDGQFTGDKGRDAFRKADREAIDQGWDLVGTAEFENAARQARAQARAEAAAMQAPLSETQAARQEALTLEQQVKTLDSTVADLEGQRPELRRRGLSDAQVKHKIGLALAERHEATKRLEQVQKGSAVQLESIPGYKFIAEQPEGDEKKLLERVVTREETAKLQAEVNMARAYRLAHPKVTILESLNLAHEGRLTLDEG
jgi:hypothetical protein